MTVIEIAYGSAAFAALAAVLWLASAIVPIPPFAATLSGGGKQLDDPPYVVAFRLQSRLSSAAAVCAAVAAALQGASTYLSALPVP